LGRKAEVQKREPSLKVVNAYRKIQKKKIYAGEKGPWLLPAEDVGSASEGSNRGRA